MRWTRRPAGPSRISGTAARCFCQAWQSRDSERRQPRRRFSTGSSSCRVSRRTCGVLMSPTGKQLWTFHTVPHPGEFGYDTWDKTETYGANAWAGMALDEQRGIAYITTAVAQAELHRRAPSRTESFRQLRHRAGRPHGPAALAFPGNPPRHLGPRHYRAAQSWPPSRATAGRSTS